MDILLRLIRDLKARRPGHPVIAKLKATPLGGPLPALTAEDEAIIRPFLRFEDCLSAEAVAAIRDYGDYPITLTIN